MAIYHTKNLSSPAAEIEARYLADLHQKVSLGNQFKADENNLQIKIISEEYSPNEYAGIMDVTLTDFYVIVSDSKVTLMSTIKTISRTKSFNQEGRYLVLFNNPDQRDEGRYIACEFLNLLFTKYRAVNIVLLFANGVFSYDIYIGDPYGKRGRVCGSDDAEKATCGKMKIFIAGNCNRGVIENKKLTVQHLNANKIPIEMDKSCIFKFCARVQEPFVNQYCHTGLEVRILDFLQDEMGFQVNTTCTDFDRGEKQEDGSWSDLLGMVKNGECDIVAGAFFPDYDTHDDFAATDFYLQDYYRIFIPKAQLAPRWKGLVTIYEPQIWYAALTIFLISWAFWFIIGIFSPESYQHRQFILISLNVICVILGVSANNRPQYTTLRFFFSILALYSLILTTLYTSKLINVFTNPKDDYQIDSIVELLDTELPLGGRLETKDWFNNDDESDMEIFNKYNSSEAFRPSPKTVREISEGKMALLISQFYVEQTAYRDNVFGMTEELFSNHLEMLAERGFPLIKRINKILGLFRDIGIMSKLFRDFYYDSNIYVNLKWTIRIEMLRNKGELTQEIIEYFEDNRDDNDDEKENPEIVLTPEHLQGPFTIWLLGLSISCFIFILELIFNIEVIRIFCAKIWKPFGDTVEKTKSKLKKFFPKNEINFRIKKNIGQIRFTPKKRRVIVFESTKSKMFSKK